VNGPKLESTFAEGDTRLHALDPRIKLICAALYSGLVVALNSPGAIAAALAFSALLVLSTRPGLRPLMRRLIQVNALVAFLWLFLPWSVPGEEIARWGPIGITRPGVARALHLTAKCNAIVLALIALLGTSRLAELAHGMQRLHVPRKLAVIFFFCIRYIHVIYDEYRRLAEAALVRAFKPGTSLRAYRTKARMFAELLVRSHDRSKRICEAMRCRGFSGSFPSRPRAPVNARDRLAGAVLLAAMVLLGIIEWRLKNR